MPGAIVGEDGVTAIEIGSRRHGCTTVKEVVAVTPWSVAVMVVFPETVAVVASPFCRRSTTSFSGKQPAVPDSNCRGGQPVLSTVYNKLLWEATCRS